jgi:hypothetical protein
MTITNLDIRGARRILHQLLDLSSTFDQVRKEFREDSWLQKIEGYKLVKSKSSTKWS